MIREPLLEDAINSTRRTVEAEPDALPPSEGAAAVEAETLTSSRRGSESSAVGPQPPGHKDIPLTRTAPCTTSACAFRADFAPERAPSYVSVNVHCVILAGVVSLVSTGIRPLARRYDCQTSIASYKICCYVAMARARFSSTASRTLLVILFPHVSAKLLKAGLAMLVGVLHHVALAVSFFWLACFLCLLDLADHALEGFADVLVVACTGLDKPAAQLFGETLTIGGLDLSLFGAEVGLVRYDLDGHGVGTQVVEDLLANDSDHFKALLGSDRVDDHVAVDANEVLAVEYRVLILTCGVDDLHGEVLVPVANDFAERVLNGRVVRVDKVPVDILNGEGTLADRSTADNGHLALLLLGRHIGELPE